MSRKEELIELADLFHLQADLTHDPAAKKALRKIGDQYQREVRQQLREQAFKDIDKPPSSKHAA